MNKVLALTDKTFKSFDTVMKVLHPHDETHLTRFAEIAMKFGLYESPIALVASIDWNDPTVPE